MALRIEASKISSGAPICAPGPIQWGDDAVILRLGVWIR